MFGSSSVPGHHVIQEFDHVYSGWSGAGPASSQSASVGIPIGTRGSLLVRAALIELALAAIYLAHAHHRREYTNGDIHMIRQGDLARERTSQHGIPAYRLS
jgi:hypothetical protein